MSYAMDTGAIIAVLVAVIGALVWTCGYILRKLRGINYE